MKLHGMWLLSLLATTSGVKVVSILTISCIESGVNSVIFSVSFQALAIDYGYLSEVKATFWPIKSVQLLSCKFHLQANTSNFPRGQFHAHRKPRFE